MKTYEMITLEQAAQLPLNSLIDDYNSAIEMIWHLQHKLQEQTSENEQLWEAYESLTDQLYG